LPDFLFDRVTDLRVNEPELIAAEASARRRRPRLTEDGRLVILAADHPARYINNVGDDPLAMGNRRAYLERIVRVLYGSAVDGIMAPPDIIDELFLLNYLIKQAGGESFLDGKLIVGCVNRGGLAGAVWELDDFLTGYTPERIAAMRLDGAKMMFRLNLEERDAAKTLEYCAQWITALNSYGLPTFLEPLPVAYERGSWRIRMTADDLVRVVGVASALGDSSAYLWLKLPMVPEFRRVALATTLPILLLGGESHGEPARLVKQVAETMQAGSNVRGALVGRNVVWPGPHDPHAVAMAISRVVRGAGSDEAVAAMEAEEGQGMDAIHALFAKA